MTAEWATRAPRSPAPPGTDQAHQATLTTPTAEASTPPPTPAGATQGVQERAPGYTYISTPIPENEHQ